VVDVPGSNCTKKLISERVAGLSPEPGPDRPSQLPTGHHQKPVLEFFGLRNFFQLFSFALSLFFIRFHSSKSRLQRHYPVVGTWKNFSFFRTLTFFQLFLFFNFLTPSRFARRIDFISVDIKSHLSAKAQQLFDIF
jgi:hypothetical protein